jgi:hypothetical protein
MLLVFEAFYKTRKAKHDRAGITKTWWSILDEVSMQVAVVTYYTL